MNFRFFLLCGITALSFQYCSTFQRANDSLPPEKEPSVSKSSVEEDFSNAADIPVQSDIPETEQLLLLYSDAQSLYKNGEFSEMIDKLEEGLDLISEIELTADERFENDSGYQKAIDQIIAFYKQVMDESKVKSSIQSTYRASEDSHAGKIEQVSTEYEIPFVVNDRVQKVIEYFQGNGRPVFTAWLDRYNKYESLIKKILQREGVPEDLIFLAMVESGFNPFAHSRANAVGPWQFISSTGRIYGLEINTYIDERRNVEKSTVAAARFMKRLYDGYQDWYLAIASYNVSKRKVDIAIKRHKTRDFWKLRTLPRETRNHVPNFIAAGLIVKNPEKYGFTIPNHKPIAYEEVVIKESVGLDVVAKCVGADFNLIRELNAELKYAFTPALESGYQLKIPKGTTEIFNEKYAQVPKSEKLTRVVHKVRRGETLSGIAKKYGTSITNIMSFNNIRNKHRISIGQTLILPIVPQEYQKYNIQYARSSSRPSQKTEKILPPDHSERTKIIYEVRKGDTLGQIAEDYNIRAQDIRRWNSLSYREFIYPGQELDIWMKKVEKKDTNAELNASNTTVMKAETIEDNGRIHIVKRGENLWNIARLYDVTLNALMKSNNKRRSTIYPGEQLVIPIN